MWFFLRLCKGKFCQAELISASLYRDFEMSSK